MMGQLPSRTSDLTGFRLRKGQDLDFVGVVIDARFLPDIKPVRSLPEGDQCGVATAEEAAASVTADAGSVTGTRTGGDLVPEQHSDWFAETPHRFKKGRLIVIARDQPEVLRALEVILGPQFAGG